MRGVLGLDDLRLEELRTELIEQHHGGHAANGVLRGFIQKPAPIERAVDVRVEQNEQFLIEVMSGLAFHRSSSWQACCKPCFYHVFISSASGRARTRSASM